MNAPIKLNPTLRWPAKYNEVPKEIFDREDIFQLEMERIFYGPEWHVVAHRAEIPKPGDYKTFAVGQRPVLIIHGEDRKIRVFYNACSHRGNQLVTGFRGNKMEYECAYHRWLFDSRGKLCGAPSENEFSPSYRRENFGLAELPVAEVAGTIFTTCSSETPDIDTFLGRVKGPWEESLAHGKLKLIGYQKVMYDANWKAYIDNDGYHAPLLHLAFRKLNWQGGGGSQITTERGHMAFMAETTQVANPDFLKDPSLVAFVTSNTSKGSTLAISSPLTASTKHMDIFSIRFATPRAVNKTEVHYSYYVHQDDDEELARHRLRQSSNLLGPCGMVSMEDASIFSRIHIGNHTPGNAVFQKGVTYEDRIWYDYKQNDESGNLPRWEYYRKMMGFERGE